MTKKLMSTSRLLLAIAVTLIIFFPMYWLLVTSVKSPVELRLATPTFWPREWHWENYVEAFKAAPFLRYGLNTVIKTAGVVLLQVNVSLWAAYAFAKGTFAGRDKLFIVVLAALMVPEQVTFIPVYIMMAKLGWLNTFLALIIPHGASAYSIFLLRQSFRSINNDVVEAARVDGAHRLNIIYKILTPMAWPTVVTVLLFKVISNWNSYFWPLIMTNTNEMRVLTVAIAMLKDSFAGNESLNFHLIMAGSAMCIAPIVVLFIIAQKHIVAALSNSTFK